MSGLGALLLTLVAATSPLPNGSPAPLPLDQPFVVTVGEMATVEGGLSLRFVSVTEDSRCPADVVCVWEGNARVALELWIDDDAPVSLSLDTNADFTTEAPYGGYTVGLVGLEPYPLSEAPSDEPYRAAFVVTASPAEPRAAREPDALVAHAASSPTAAASASPAPAPSASPNPAPSVAPAPTPRPAIAAIATALLFSGVPDPDWTLTQADLDGLTAIAAGLETVEATPSEGGLGYRGFRVTGPQGTWRVNGELVLAPDSAPGTALADPERLVERYLLETGLATLTEDEAEIVADALDAAASPAPG